MILDEILENKIQMGRFQYISFFFISLIEFNDGTQMILNALLAPILHAKWKLDPNQLSNLVSIFYFGAFIGAIIGGKFADKFGRKPAMVVGSILQIIVSLFFLWIKTYVSFLIIRGIYGIIFGFTIVLTSGYFAELTPLKYRGKGILLINFSATSGKFYGIALALIFLKGYINGNWRIMMALGSLPSIIVLVGAATFMRESPRFLISTKRFQQAYQVLQHMAMKNHPQQNSQNFLLTLEQRQELVQYERIIYQGKQKGQFTSLFNSYYLRTTLFLSGAWFSLNFIYFGQLTSLPFIFNQTHKSLGAYALAILGQVPTIILSLLLIDRPNFGRKKSLVYFFILSSLVHFLFALKQLIFFSALCRFFMKMCFQIIYPITAQSYGTQNRILGFGFNSGIGRLGATLMPYLIIPLVEGHPWTASIVFGIVALIGSLCAFLIPNQTMNLRLDENIVIKNENQQIQGE